ncbi:Plasmodium vivax Vir protein, putative [Plasmodium ovale]|nr:Plasmodium vivax Vir protein, putative [Plasmodium ovale]
MSNYSWLKNSCEKFANNLINISYNAQDGVVDKRCDYLNYWVCGEVIKNIGSSDTENFIQITAKLLVAWSNINSHYVNKGRPCSYVYNIFNNKPENFIEWKDLHDYCDDFEYIKSKIQTSSNKCNKYCNYLLSKSSLYNKYDSICSSSTEKQNCPNFFKNCKEHNPNTLFSELGCKKENECKVLSEKPDVSRADQEQIKDDTGEEAKITEYSSSPQEHTPQNLNFSMHAALSLFGILLSFLFLISYKFTPLKPLLLKCLFKKQTDTHYEDEEGSNFSSYIYDNGDGNVENSRRLIGYNTVQIS